MADPPAKRASADEAVANAVADAATDREPAKRPRRACTLPGRAADPATGASTELLAARGPRPRPAPGTRILIIHANGKPYGYGPSGITSDDTAVGVRAIAAKASNKLFDFSCAEYEAMRDSGLPYSGDPRKNPLLPLPRPTYTEFINRVSRRPPLPCCSFLPRRPTAL